MDRLELGVEVDNTRYVSLLSLTSRATGRLPLTTIAPRQRRAIVRVAVLRNGTPTPVGEITVSGAALSADTHPQIDLEARYNGRAQVELRLFVNGRRYTSRRVDVSRFLQRESGSTWLVVAAAAAILLAVAVGVFLLVRDVGEQPRVATPVQRPLSEPSDGDSAAADSGPVSPSAGERATPRPDVPQPTTPSRDHENQQAEVEARTQQDPVEADSRDQQVPAEADEPADSTGPAVATDEPAGDAIRAEQPDDSATADAPSTQQPAFGGPVDDVLPPRADDPVIVYFLPDSSEILPEVRARLRRLYAVLAEHRDYRLVIEGHCAIAGSEAGRAEISRNRAQNVRAVLAGLGWEFDPNARVTGLGATEPLTLDTSQQYLNRRVEIWALPPAPQERD